MVGVVLVQNEVGRPTGPDEGLAFNAGVWAALGAETAMAWLDGYILEYLLSMDNVFFFHVVFKSYATPDDQIYQGLFLGMPWVRRACDSGGVLSRSVL